MIPNGNKSGDDDGELYDGLDDGLDGGPTDPARLGALRDELKRRDLDGFIQPRSDEHQGEYVARKSERLAWLSDRMATLQSLARKHRCDPEALPQKMADIEAELADRLALFRSHDPGKVFLVGHDELEPATQQ